MRISVMKESAAGERRVALLPESVKRLVGKKVEISVESGAGHGVGFSDEDYKAAGATVAADAKGANAGSAAVLKVQPPTDAELDTLPSGGCIVSLMYPLSRREA